MNTAIILAQGQGSKLWPLGSTRPKAAIPIGGSPLLRQQIASLEAAGVGSILVVANARFAAHLRFLAAGKGSHPQGAAGMLAVPPSFRPTASARRAASPNGTAGERAHRALVEVLSFDPPQGTAPALRLALEQVEDEHVLVLYGDVLLDPGTLPRLLEAQAEDPSSTFVLAVPLHPLEDPTMYLAVRVREGRVEEMIAHPRHSITHRLGGAFVFPRAVIQPYLAAQPGYVPAVPSGGMPPIGEADLAQCLQMMVEDGLTVRAVEPSAFALDVDRPWDILIANHLWLDLLGQSLDHDVIHPTARISERAEVNGHLVVGENAVIGPGAILEGNAWIDCDAVVTHGAIVGPNTYIGRRCVVRDDAWIGEHTSLGPLCKIGHCAEIHGVMFGRSTVMHYCNVWGVLGEASDVGAGTAFGTLRFDDQPQAHRVKGRWETPRHASDATFIGDFCRTGVNAIFLPGSKVGAYSAIGPGVVVDGDVPEHSLLLLKQEVERREWGPEKYGW